MRGRLILTLAVALSLSGCGRVAESRLNPFNWFGAREAAEPVSPLALPADPRPLIEQVTSVTIDRTPGGAIVRATGLPPSVGYWNADLVPADRDGRPDENGVLVLDFRAVSPLEPRPGSAAARQIVAGHFISEQRLRDIRAVTVNGQTRGVTVRR